MKDFHFIAGLPRSGSTLLCSILNQNPDFKATHTSNLPGVVDEYLKNFSKFFEHYDKALLQHRIDSSVEGLFRYFYKEENIVFDKDRGWTLLFPYINKIFPQSRIIFPVRNIIDIFSSIELQHRRTETFFYKSNLSFSVSNERIKILFKSLISSVLQALEECLFRELMDKILIVDYKSLVKDPHNTLDSIHSFLNYPEYQYDFNHIVSTAEENNDGNLKYPHKVKSKLSYVTHHNVLSASQEEFLKEEIKPYKDLLGNSND